MNGFLYGKRYDFTLLSMNVFLMNGKVCPHTIVHVLVGVCRVKLLNKDIIDISTNISETICYVIIVADKNTWKTWK